MTIANQQRRRWRGFTLLEFAVVVAIIGILGTALLGRVVSYQEQAEKAAMEQMLGILRSALHLQMAGLQASGKGGDIALLAGQNPMDWLAEKPGNYVGEYYMPTPGLVADGNWYFDLQDKSLVYQVKRQAHLHTANGEGNRLHFQARLIGNPNDRGGRDVVDIARRNVMPVEGVVLEPVASYDWF